jgi:hypothetical protein
MTNTTPDDDLTPAEVAAFATLPRAAAGEDRLAEERTVRALREAGLLGSAGARRNRQYLMTGAGIAAAFTIFVAGTAVGRGLAQREVQAPTLSPAAEVQEAGTAYVAALIRLSRATKHEQSPGVEAGAATLRAAATSLAHINANDPLADRLRMSLAAAAAPADSSQLSRDPSIIWF